MEANHRQAWEEALEFLKGELKCDRALVLASRPEGDPEVVAAHGVDPDTVWTVGEVSHDVLRKAAAGQSIMLSDAIQDPKFGDRSSVILSGLRSILCVPVKDGGKVVGVLYVDSQLKTGLFGAKHKKLLQAYAAELAPKVSGG